MIYYADFETSPYVENKHDNVRVYAWAVAQLKSKSLDIDDYGIDIESFLNFGIKKATENPKNQAIFYFHNLRFDLSYIIDYITRYKNAKPFFNLGYVKAIAEKYDYDINDLSIFTYKDNSYSLGLFPDENKELMPGRYKGIKISYLINKATNKRLPFEVVAEKYVRNKHNIYYKVLQTARGAVFEATISFKGIKLRFKDTAKLLPMQLKKIPLPTHIKAKKGDINHTIYRQYNNKEELKNDIEVFEYLKNDVLVLKYGHTHMIKMFESLDADVKMTTAGTAYETFKNMCKDFKDYFPILDIDIHTFLAEAYRGGVSTPKKEIICKVIFKGLSVDENSEYPSVMLNYYLPIGKPTKITDEKDLNINKWFACEVTFTKAICDKNKFPLIPKNGMFKNNMKYEHDNYTVDGNYRLVLSKNDYLYFKENYKIENYRFVKAYQFEVKKGIFNEYITKWHDVKTKYSKIRDNLELKNDFDSVEYNEAISKIMIAKLMLNSLYGKFGTKYLVESSISVLNENGLLSNIFYSERVKQFYMAIACAITDYARYDLVNLINPNYDRWLYSDTDSNHFSGWEPLIITGNCKPLGNKLGEWEIEGYYDRMSFLKPKCYYEQYANHDKNNKYKIGTVKFKSAGINVDFDKIGFENFKRGYVIENGKTMLKTLEGGKAVIKTNVKL